MYWYVRIRILNVFSSLNSGIFKQTYPHIKMCQCNCPKHRLVRGLCRACVYDTRVIISCSFEIHSMIKVCWTWLEMVSGWYIYLKGRYHFIIQTPTDLFHMLIQGKAYQLGTPSKIGLDFQECCFYYISLLNPVGRRPPSLNRGCQKDAPSRSKF